MDEYKREIYLGMMLTLVLGSTSLAREKLQEKNLCTEIERHAEGNTKEKELIGTEWKEI